ncbi:type I glutamate--ammonia ligase [bacterium]|nr:type I glutamate--ammonia ligase [candidate division CSSED10-310 bacterium]
MDKMTADQFKKIQTQISDSHIEMIDLKFVDLHGKFRHVTLPVKSFNESVLEEGVGFDGSSVGFKSVKSGDMCLIPDLTTSFMDPFWDVPTISLFCNIVEADTRIPFIGDPRSIAIRALSYLGESGIGSEVYILPEFEFNIFDSVVYQTDPHESYFQISSRESTRCSRDFDSPMPGFWIPHQSGYHYAPPSDAFKDIRTTIVNHASNLGIDVKYHHHEVGASGQQEIELTLSSMIKACDQSMLLRYIIKNEVLAHGLTATFMPKPILGEAGNGMHVHMRLAGQADEPVFYDPNDELGLSEIAYCFIGGIITHGRSLAAFTNPSTNSYRRLIKGFEAPTNLFFSLGSRNSAIRIPKYATAPEKKRFEFRSPDATCNIYFAISAMLMAGLDGVKNGIHARENLWGPFNDINHLSKKQIRNIPTLPESLEEALEYLSKDNGYLKAGGVFTNELINGWRKIKSEKEVIPIKNSPTPLEYSLYFNC